MPCRCREEVCLVDVGRRCAQVARQKIACTSLYGHDKCTNLCMVVSRLMAVNNLTLKTLSQLADERKSF